MYRSTVVYLFLVNYGRSKPDQIHLVIPNFLQVSTVLRGSARQLIINRTVMIGIPLSELWQSVPCLTSKFPS